MSGKRGSIGFFATYRPPVPLDIFSSQASTNREIPMTDGHSYNYSGQAVPPKALKAMLKRPKLASLGCTEADVDTGRASGMMFVSERSHGLETLHLGLSFGGKINIFGFADVYDLPNDVRLEDSPCFAGKDSEYIVYISTKERSLHRRQPWTAVFKTNLVTGKTDRLTPRGEADLSPSVSPLGKKIAVASFEGKQGGWNGEIKDLNTNIYVMDLDKPSPRVMVVKNGGWPTWGSEDVLFFHRQDDNEFFGVYKADISKAYKSGLAISDNEAARITPKLMNAMTPTAIDFETVVVAIVREISDIAQSSSGRGDTQYRHIEIFKRTDATKVTQAITPKADHFNPFVIDAGKRIIGYHRCRIDEHLMNGGQIERKLNELKSPHRDVEVIRSPGAFPAFSKDGAKIAFVDNEFKAVWVADDQGLRVVFNAPAENSIFSTVWNKNTKLDTLYVCMGPAFMASKDVHIHAIPKVGLHRNVHTKLTSGNSNNAFPSTNKDGTMIVFRSTRDGGVKRYKSLYLMDSAGRHVKRLTTKENCIDTHCQWSPSGDWIVFASNRDKPSNTPESDNNLDTGYFSVFLIRWDEPDVIVRIMQSGADIAGHVNHPFFSPDGKSIVVVSDLAGVSVDPISMPIVSHSVRPYGDIFSFDIDTDDIENNFSIDDFKRVTHSRFENSTPTWADFSLMDPRATLKLDLMGNYKPACPYIHSDGGQSWHMSGHLCIPKSCC